MLNNVYKSQDLSVYQIEDDNSSTLLNRYIVSTANTREICNDPQICGIEYTHNVKEACRLVLEAMPSFSDMNLHETTSMVLNVLRGGLNFELREALAEAYSWNIHATSFISAQRARTAADSEQWHIVESEYRKLYLPQQAQIILGDVVATGTSLQHALRLIIKEAVESDTPIRSMVFFTFGGIRSEEILNEIALICKKEFDTFEGINLFYFEGRFVVPDKKSPLSVRITGTDLVRLNALMAPEFLISQYELPYYPLERCIIYDAGSRAFHVEEYVEDVVDYWKRTKELAMTGMDYVSLLHQRFPEIDASKFGKQNLISLCEQHISKLKRILEPKEPTESE